MTSTCTLPGYLGPQSASFDSPGKQKPSEANRCQNPPDGTKFGVESSIPILDPSGVNGDGCDGNLLLCNLLVKSGANSTFAFF